MDTLRIASPSCVSQSHAKSVVVDNLCMNAIGVRRSLAIAGLLSLIAGYFTTSPISFILFGLGALLVGILLARRRQESDLAAQASEARGDPSLMTVWEVAEAAGAPAKKIVLALERDGVPRADRLGWRARLPTSMIRIRYWRTDIERWLNTRQENPAAS